MATVESILLYGSETWTLTERLEKQIDGCHNKDAKDGLQRELVKALDEQRSVWKIFSSHNEN